MAAIHPSQFTHPPQPITTRVWCRSPGACSGVFGTARRALARSLSLGRGGIPECVPGLRQAEHTDSLPSEPSGKPRISARPAPYPSYLPVQPAHRSKAWRSPSYKVPGKRMSPDPMRVVPSRPAAMGWEDRGPHGS